MKDFKDLLTILSSDDKAKLYRILFLILIMAVLDAAGVASIMPFLALVAKPEMISQNLMTSFLFELSGAKTHVDFLFLLGICLLSFLFLTVLARTYIQYAVVWYSNHREYTFGRRLLHYYLSQPYEWFLNKNSADFSKAILSEVNQVVHGVLLPSLFIISNAVIAVMICVVIFISNPIVAALVFLFVASTTCLMMLVTRGFLNRLSIVRLEANRTRYTSVLEAFGGLKETKLASLERAFVERFSQSAEKYAISFSRSFGVGLIPRAMLEIFAFGGILFATLVFITRGQSLTDIVPLLSLYAFAAYRLIPSVQQIYSNYSTLKFSISALKNIKTELCEQLNSEFALQKVPRSSQQFEKSLTLKKLQYSYPGCTELAIDGVDLEIEVGSRIGIVGYSGSGKTTLVDIIIGLLVSSNKNSMLVDGDYVHQHNVAKWRSIVGYVPQQLFLLDDTVAANVAFGVRSEEIDLNKVRSAAKIANIAEFIERELPGGYDAELGERGQRLSGGQRQRIGIARALYRDPKIIVLDEATSALDARNEAEVIRNILKVDPEITIITIAHRVEALADYDKIFVVDRGQVVGQGTFEFLLKHNELFKTLV